MLEKTTTRPRGRPPVPPDEKLLMSNVGFTQSQREIIRENGGYAWLRGMVDAVGAAKKKGRAK